jgi:hypothetical protein
VTGQAVSRASCDPVRSPAACRRPIRRGVAEREAAWHYRHAPRRPTSGAQPDERAWQAQVRLHQRYRHLTEHGKRPTVVNIAVARELVGFLWAAMTDQPLTTREHQEAAA